jgi:hypothetical protein
MPDDPLVQWTDVTEWAGGVDVFLVMTTTSSRLGRSSSGFPTCVPSTAQVFDFVVPTSHGRAQLMRPDLDRTEGGRRIRLWVYRAK